MPEGASASNGTVICREYGVPDTGYEDDSSFTRFLNLTNVMFSFIMTSVLASYSDKFKIIITLRWAQNFLVREPIKIVIFSLTHICMSFFSISPEN